jgi:hypothetical protein
MERLRAFSKYYAVAVVIIALNLAPQISSFYDARNRYFMLWELSDGLALILINLLLGLGAVILYLLFQIGGCKRVLVLFKIIFITAVGSAILSNLDPYLSGNWIPWISVGWLIVAGITGWYLGNQRLPIIRYGFNLCLLFSPFAIILFYQVLSLKTFGTPPEARPEFSRSDKPSYPIFIFVFDEWSFDRSTEEGGFLPYFVNVRKLASESFTFLEARSPSASTKVSLPAIIYQRAANGIGDPDYRYWEKDGDLLPDSKSQSLFQMAKSQNYDTALVGWYLPYRRILGDQVDYVDTRSHESKGKGLGQKMIMSMMFNFKFLTDPISRALDKRLNAWIDSHYYYDMNQEFVREANWMIDYSENNTFIFIHWPVPHSPFVLNPDGTYWGSYYHLGGKPSGAPEDYERHLRYVDKLIGQLMERLRSADQYDDALIIITADHSWNKDPKNGFEQLETNTHVPLFLKLPYQKRPHTIEREFRNNQIGPIIEHVMRHEANEDHVRMFIEQADASTL